MKLILTAVLIAILTYMLQGFGPWWLGALIAVLGTFVMRLKPGAGIAAGFLGLFLAWGITAGWIDMQNHSILSARVGGIFGSLPSFAMILLTGLVGGLVGALAGLTGGLAAQWIQNSPSSGVS